MSGSERKQWVLLVAGSKGWTNYRHQANVCHAYQMVQSNGIPNDQVVVMMYDDIAYSEQNPHPGEIINEPGGPNVYPGVLKDYTGVDVSVANFLAVLRGDEAGVNKQTGGPVKVLRSDERDTVFIYLADHGSTGVFAFPREFLHASDLVDTINEMARCQKFSQMVIYMESCCSGSMMLHLPKNAQAYGVAASLPYESHCACFYDEDRLTFLAGEFTSCWLFHSQTSDLTQTTFQDQFVFLQQKITQSTPCQYGNNELSSLTISDVLGNSDPRTRASRFRGAETFQLTHLTPSSEVPLIIQRRRIQRESNPVKKEALQRDLDKLLQTRNAVKKAVHAIAKRACPEEAARVMADRRPLTRLADMKALVEHFSRTFSGWSQDQLADFGLLHMHVFVNLCESGVDIARIEEAITTVSSLTEFW
ncbi:legumain-like isoform X2 [Electrophorus electricus]|uniref:legumain-like isoform X2 n=1 Tax=Electrophorus electricus TaxID=8005 RepID=UPI000F09D59C|nr:legumain-like isoform X2 [Electrophorus electricus]